MKAKFLSALLIALGMASASAHASFPQAEITQTIRNFAKSQVGRFAIGQSDAMSNIARSFSATCASNLGPANFDGLFLAAGEPGSVPSLGRSIQLDDSDVLRTLEELSFRMEFLLHAFNDEKLDQDKKLQEGLFHRWGPRFIDRILGDFEAFGLTFHFAIAEEEAKWMDILSRILKTGDERIPKAQFAILARTDSDTTQMPDDIYGFSPVLRDEDRIDLSPDTFAPSQEYDPGPAAEISARISEDNEYFKRETELAFHVNDPSYLPMILKEHLTRLWSELSDEIIAQPVPLSEDADYLAAVGFYMSFLADFIETLENPSAAPELKAKTKTFVMAEILDDLRSYLRAGEQATLEQLLRRTGAQDHDIQMIVQWVKP